MLSNVPVRLQRRLLRHVLPCVIALATTPLVAAEPAKVEASASPFDGTLAGWTMEDGRPVEGWEVVDGMIHRKPAARRAGHIITVEEFSDFTLSFEWRISPGGNSGIKYWVRPYGKKLLGCEYQILGEAGSEKKAKPKNSTGAIYDLYEPNAKKQLKPVDEFNAGKIVVRDGHIEHWLNGELIVTANVGDADWNSRIAASKFSDVPAFARDRRGKLMLTDHGSEIWFRNFRLELPSAERTGE